MKQLYKNIFAVILGLFNTLLVFYIFIQLYNIIDFNLLKAGYIEGVGVIHFLKVYAGIPLFYILAIGIVGIVIYSFEYYLKGLDELIKRFSFITFIEFYLLSIVLIIYQLIFPFEFQLETILLIITSFVLGTCFYYLHKKR